MHQLKYKRVVALGAAVASLHVQKMCVVDWPVSLAVLVPLRPTRLAFQGFDRSKFFTPPLAPLRSFGYVPGALKRVRETATQIVLSAAERHRNVIDAFDSDPKTEANSPVQIVDDVITNKARCTPLPKAC